MSRTKRNSHDERHPEVVRIVENSRPVDAIEHHPHIPEPNASVVLDDAVDREKHVQRNQQIDQPFQLALRVNAGANQEVTRTRAA